MNAIPKNILVIRMSAMGDVALTVPVLLALVEQHPEVKITMLSKPFMQPIFSNIPNVIFLGADTSKKYKGILGVFKLFWHLKLQNFDAIADLHNVLRSKILRFLFLFFSFKNIKIAKIDKGRAEKKALTALKNKKLKPLKHTTKRYAEVFEILGFSIHLTAETVKNKEVLNEHILKITQEKNKQWIGVAPFAQHPSKIYPEKQILEVLLEIHRQKNVKIFLFGGGSKEIETLENWAKTHLFLTIIAGKLSFSDELSLISNLDVMLSMDSGNGHLAAMFGIPVLTIWGGTHPFLGFTPYNQTDENQILANLINYPLLPLSVYGTKTLEGYETVMESIPTEKITHQLLKILEK